MLAEVTEITDKVKLMQLFNLMYSNNPEEFETKLKILPVDLVKIVFRMCSSVFVAPGQQHKCAWSDSRHICATRDTFAERCGLWEKRLCQNPVGIRVIFSLSQTFATAL